MIFDYLDGQSFTHKSYDGTQIISFEYLNSDYIKICSEGLRDTEHQHPLEQVLVFLKKFNQDLYIEVRELYPEEFL